MRRFTISLCLVAISGTAALLFAGAPAGAQMSYMNVPRHQPIWSPSVHGGFYDATGVIQGAVAERDLPLYGGRYMDGRPVDGTAKLRDIDGRLLTEDQYVGYRQSLYERLNRINDLTRRSRSLGFNQWQLDNLRAERNEVSSEIASLERSYAERTPYTPGRLISQPYDYTAYGQPAYGYGTNPYGYGTPAYGLPAYGLPASTSSVKQSLVNQGLNFLSRFGF